MTVTDDPVFDVGPVPPPPTPTVSPTDAQATAIAAGFLVIRGLVSSELLQRVIDATLVHDPGAAAREAWGKHLPFWMRLVTPAIEQLYLAGSRGELSTEQVHELARQYTAKLGEDIDRTSAAAISEGFARQLDARWSEPVAWQRVTAAYGLDRPRLLAWLSNALHAPDKVQTFSRGAVDQLLLARAVTIGENEAWRARQTAQVLTWAWQAANGLLLPTAAKVWRTARDERTCPMCGAIDGQVAGLTDPFVFADGSEIFAPPAHPRCRCHADLTNREPDDYGLAKSLAGGAFKAVLHPRGRGGKFTRIGTAAGIAAVGGATLVIGARAARRFRAALPEVPALVEGAPIITPYRHLAERISGLDDDGARALMRRITSLPSDDNGYFPQEVEDYQFGLTGSLNVTAHVVNGMNGRGGVIRLGPHADAVRRLQAAAVAEDTPELHRGMTGVEHEVGDVIDFRKASSFSADPAIARMYGTVGDRKGIYVVPAGHVPAVPIGGGLQEWLLGGTFRVVGKEVRDGRPHYQLEHGDRVAKAFDPQKHPRGQRQNHGWFAPVTFAEPEPESVAAPVAPVETDPFADYQPASADPFAAADPFAMRQGGADPFAADPFAAANPFDAPGDPFAAELPGASRRRRRILVVLPPPPERPGDSDQLYTAQRQDFEEIINPPGVTPSSKGNWHQRTHKSFESLNPLNPRNDGVIDFDALRDSAYADEHNPANAPWARHVAKGQPLEAGAAPDSPLDGKFWNQRNADGVLVNQELLKQARLEAGDMAPRLINSGLTDDPVLDEDDLRRILSSAGTLRVRPQAGRNLVPTEHLSYDEMRGQLLRAFEREGTGSGRFLHNGPWANAQREAFMDYVAWTVPRVLGPQGQALAQRMADAPPRSMTSTGTKVPFGYNEPPVRDIYVFSNGLHPPTDPRYREGQHRELPLHGKYRVDNGWYASAPPGVASAGIAGYRYLHLVPMTGQDDRPPKPRIYDPSKYPDVHG